MIRQISYKHSNGTFPHDDEVSESTIRSNCPRFFSQESMFGKRPTYTFYRGFIICRMTRGGERCTVMYIYSPDMEGTANVLLVDGACGTIRLAQRRADEVIRQGTLNEKRGWLESKGYYVGKRADATAPALKRLVEKPGEFVVCDPKDDEDGFAIVGENFFDLLNEAYTHLNV